uniref:serine--tRNA ligase n=1 Tax=Lactuca sativa TaxID=4236 RepID=A0A9R1W0E8_LACSA|nr:hypothetical protein LSAT_V11C400174290 [Lactuca sativa]
MLDINRFREEKGNNPEIIRESQRQRFADVEIVDEIIHLDKKLRKRQYKHEQLLKVFNNINKEVAKLSIAGEDASSKIKNTEEIKDSIAKKGAKVQEARAALYSKLSMVGNLVHDSVPVSNDKANNVVVRTWGVKRTEPKLKNHVELMELLGIADLENGAKIAGKGGFCLLGDGLHLNLALIKFGLDFLEERGFTSLQTPSFMTENIMGKCTHSVHFDKELYKVTGEGEDKYLIGTTAQPLCAYNIDGRVHPTELPIRQVGYSTCFRKNAGSDGIFDPSQCEKVEQLCITSPNGNDSWDMHEEMIKNSEEFYQMLKLPYHIVSVVSGALNNAAAKTYDLEAWFPASNNYRQLLSCSNCTDYQSRKLEIKFGQKTVVFFLNRILLLSGAWCVDFELVLQSNEQMKQYCHLLNCTLTEAEKTMCCILENYQREDGVEVPKVLQPYMGGKTFMAFQAPPSDKETKATQTQNRSFVHPTEGKKEGESMLDINLFWEEKGTNPEIIRESQRRRFKNVEIGDEIIHFDKEWRQRQTELTQLHQDLHRTAGEEETKDLIAKKVVEVQEARSALCSKLSKAGNRVHDSVPVSNDEANNVVVRTWGEKRTEPKLKNHVELVELLGIADLEKGVKVAGGRGYCLKGAGLHLNHALIKFGCIFLVKRGFKSIKTPFFMVHDIMEKCPQLTQFNEELYKVTGEGDDKYLIATAEQPLCAYNIDKWIHPQQLPIRYAGYSSCFRKEAGSHGHDTRGLFRVHEFQKVEQFCITSPNGNQSWDMLEEMIKNSEEFYQMLKLPYRVVSIVSGALNDAAAKKYDLEAWFPASSTYRELVSCSNCTDYQSRKLEIRFGEKKSNEQTKQYYHLLNSTLTATERTICCILENYQREDGVEVPQVLQPFMGGKKFIPFQAPPVKATKGKKSK